MYANLRVVVNRPKRREQAFYAHEVVIAPNAVTIHVDANDGGQYAEPAGERKVALEPGTRIRITADF
jgi:hypothetical protein